MFIKFIRLFFKKRMIFNCIFLFLIALVIHGLMFFDMNIRADSILNDILDNNSQISSENLDSLPLMDKISDLLNLPNFKYPARYFFVVYDEEGKIVDINFEQFPNMDHKTAENLALSVAPDGAESGYISTYKYKNSVNDSGNVLVFLDQSINLYSIFISLCASIILTLIFLFILILFFNKQIKNNPSVTINENFNLQAKNSKSPVKINNNSSKISDKNRDFIHTNGLVFDERGMNKIVKLLLLLSNLEVKDWLRPFEKLNFSDLVLETTLSFQTLKEAKQKHIELNIQRNIHINGNKTYIKKAIELLMDNSIKYTSDFDNIIISLKSDDSYVEFSIKNNCRTDDLGDLSKLFQPFYRKSCKNSNNGGNFGLGLAIVKKIVDSHNAQIFANKEGKFVEFAILFQGLN